MGHDVNTDDAACPASLHLKTEVPGVTPNIEYGFAGKVLWHKRFKNTPAVRRMVAGRWICRQARPNLKVVVPGPQFLHSCLNLFDFDLGAQCMHLRPVPW